MTVLGWKKHNNLIARQDCRFIVGAGLKRKTKNTVER